MRPFETIAGFCLTLFYRTLCSTLRVVEIGRESVEELVASPSSIVVGFWHDEFFPLIYMRRQLHCMAIASASRDGDFLSGVLTRMGVEVARGSSSRKGTQALLEVVRRLQTDAVAACIALDGPRGPRHVIKPGSLFLAARAGVYIVPTRMFMERAHIFKSWDRFQLPLPFSRVRIVYGEAYRIPPACDDESLKIAVKDLHARMEALNTEGFITVAGE